MEYKKMLLLLVGITCTAFTTVAQEKVNHTHITPHNNTELKPGLMFSDTTLLADRVPTVDTKRLNAIKVEMERTLKEKKFRDALDYPAVEIYGEASWNSRSVNPFAGCGSVEMPDTFRIDCSEFSYPLDKVARVNSKYGYRRRFRRMHYGMDLKLSTGDTVRAAFDGKVRVVDYEGRGYGNYVVIRHPNGLETVYGHLSRSLVKPDAVVRAGDPIALGGSTGRSTGPHLHFETRFMGIALNPNDLINFDTGIPVQEQYVFLRKGMKVNGGGVVATRNSRSGRGGSTIAVHKIRRGDTLSSIAKKNGVTVSRLCSLNGISTKTKLQVGKSLRVSK